MVGLTCSYDNSAKWPKVRHYLDDSHFVGNNFFILTKLTICKAMKVIQNYFNKYALKEQGRLKNVGAQGYVMVGS